MQIGEFDLVHEATPIIDEQLLEEVNLTAKLSTTKAILNGGKDIEVVKRFTSPKGVGESVSKGAETFPASPTHSEHSIEGPTSLQLAAKRISTDVKKTTNHEVVKGKSMFAMVSATSFRPGPASQSIITCGIRAIGFGYLNALKNASFDEAKVYENAPMMYKSIDRFNEDPNPLKKLVDDYVSSVSAYLALRQATLTLRQPDDLGKEKAICVEHVNQVQSHLIAVQEELDAIKGKHKSATQKVKK